MNKLLAALLALMLVLSGCLGDDDVIDNDEDTKPVLLDTDGDGTPDIDDDDDDGDSWSDVDELNCNSDSLLASSVPSDIDNDGSCDVRDDDVDGDGWSNIDEEACGSDTMLASDMPNDADGDGVCDALDQDTDGDGFADGIENQCGSDPADSASVPADMDNDGTCDALDDDIDGDGVLNDEDFAPEDPTKSAGIEGCTNADAFNHNSAAEVDDGSCFTLADAEAAVVAAMAGVAMMEATDMEMGITTNMIYDGDHIRLISMSITGEDGEEMSVSYLVDGNGYVQVEQSYPETDENDNVIGSTVDLFLVDDVYYQVSVETGWSHCEFNGDVWYCVDTYDEYGDMTFNANSESETVHQFQCNDGSIVLVNVVNDGVADCADGSDEPMIQDDGRTYACADGTTVSFTTVNDGVDDCADGSDEPVVVEEFICDNGVEINGHNINDGDEDCMDGEDEPYYDMDAYELSTFTCDDGASILLSNVNDGYDDCAEGEDEMTFVEVEYTSFECADGSMIMLSQANDGTADCPNSEDEDDGTGTMTYDCLYSQETIMFEYVNDGMADCEDGTDEPEYDNEPEYKTYDCADGVESIDFEFVNDGYEDCEDGSDEPVYDLEELTDFICDDGSVIAFSAVNDGEEDCTDGEDEPTYEEVEYSSFDCASGDVIPLSSVNDGTDDCPAADDEPSYDPITQSEVSTYECLYSGETVALSTVNDGAYDCEDMTDEPYSEMEETSEFECTDGYDTVPLSFVNDGEADCRDRSDETQYDIEDENMMFCLDGTEIAVSQFNDGVEDCADGSDEEDYYECDNGDVIWFNWVNDGYDDCYDGSDEAVIEDTNVIDCIGGDGSSLTASQFHDNSEDCENGWDEMMFEQEDDCVWDENAGWLCTSAMFPTDEQYTFWEGDDGSGVAMIGLNATLSDGTQMIASFDATTHAFLMLHETSFDDDGMMEEVFTITTASMDPNLASLIVIDTALDVHAPPFALVFNGEPMSVDNDRIFTCNDGSEVPFSYVNDGAEDCGEGEDEPTYEQVEYSEFYCSADDNFIYFSQVNDGIADCSDSEDEDDGTGTMTYMCEYSGETIMFEYVNDGMADCEDETDEPYFADEETSEWDCEDGLYAIPLSAVNDGSADCEDGSDESPLGEGHGYGDYTLTTLGVAEWTLGVDDAMLDVVFMNCGSFDSITTQMTYETYLLPSNCDDHELARYSLSDIMEGNVIGLEFMEFEGQQIISVYEEFELDGWNTVRLSTPDGEFADENPEVVLPAPGVGFALIALLGAAMLLHRKPE